MSLYLLSALLVASTPVQAETPAPKKEKRICKSAPTTGTRLSRTRVCMTRAQWNAHHRQTERDVQDMGAPQLGPKE